MKCLIITVAGMSTRFSDSVGEETIKCLYYERRFEECLLYRLIYNDCDYFDKIIIVGGFHYSELMQCMQIHFCELKDKIDVIYNKNYKKYGSGYSLYLGLNRACELGASEIVFAEGDLFVSQKEFREVAECCKSVITANFEPIYASKAVAFYFDMTDKIHYIFDVKHGVLEIKEPFTSIRNSGQIWKFTEMDRIRRICSGLLEEEKQGTNLVIIQKYFEVMNLEEYIIYDFHKWINCNKVEDFRNIK